MVYAAAALAVALIGARYMKSVAAEAGTPTPVDQSSGEFRSGRAGATGAAGASGASAEKFSALVVHVAGAVRRPGVVRLRDGDRVGDAISAAGGASSKADLNAVNLALRLSDGQQVIVPASGVVTTGGGGATGPVSLSAATVDQLDELEGVGPGLAEKIVAYRTEHGGFRSVDELGEVPGIGDKRLESLRGQLQP